MDLILYNTRTRKKEVFKPLKDNLVRMYCCGPTVYWYAHIGNLRTYIFEDVLRRTLKFNGFKVKHVMNITDVGHLTSDSDEGEDKIEKTAREKKMNAWEIAKMYTEAFFNDCKKLNIEKPEIICKATDHIKDMIEWIKKLEKIGYTYRTSDGIYYDTSKFKDYPKFARLNLKKQKAGARIKFNPEKKNPWDFALWKFSPKNVKRQMEWDSPWGVGFPGWHIECSVMSTKYLGEQFDIHCGGVDHIPVHHTNEIAQTEPVTGKKPWVNFWLHGEWLILKDGKMSKSSGKIVTLSDLIKKGYNPLAYRYLVLTAHYRSKLEFSWEAMDNAQKSYESLKRKIKDIYNNINEKETTKIMDEYLNKFHKSINNDLNTPNALAVLWEVVKTNELNNYEKIKLIEEFDKILGLDLLKFEERKLSEKAKKLIKEREEARKRKDWETADKIREELRKMGIILEDKKDGTVWRFA